MKSEIRSTIFFCLAEERTKRMGVEQKYHDIGDRLMALRKKAFGKFNCEALWSVPGYAALSEIRGIAKKP